jgi:hypothetical protein
LVDYYLVIFKNLQEKTYNKHASVGETINICMNF